MRSENDWREILSDPEKQQELLINRQKYEEQNQDEDEDVFKEFLSNDTTITDIKKNHHDKTLGSLAVDNEFPDIEYYHIYNPTEESDNDKWAYAIQELTENMDKANPDTLIVYGHKVNVPWQNKGVAYFEFEDICGTYLAAADYISLASRYHTFIIDNVPALKMTQKNEARRFITLLDALYESKCRLLIRAEAPPEDMFFADARNQNEEDEDSESLVQEMFSEVHQDLSQPFRPNVSSYEGNERENEDSTTTSSSPVNEITSKRLVNNNDESVLSSTSPLEDDPSKKFFPDTASAATAPNFTKVSAFTGEDERFAYKRAVSRLKEMTGSPRWVQDARWTPVDRESRPWESFEEGVPLPDSYFLGGDKSTKPSSSSSSNSSEQQQNQLNNSNNNNNEEEEDSLKYTSPFRRNREPAPKFDAHHFWAMVQWGPGQRISDENAKEWIKTNNAYTKTTQ